MAAAIANGYARHDEVRCSGIANRWEATRQIKAAAETQDLPVIALTAHAMSGDRDRAIGVGCADYHTKPVDFPKLLAQIEALLQNPASV